MLLANFHTHTSFCDGRDTPAQVAEHALSLGIRHLGFSGHMDPDIHMDLPAYRQEIARLREEYAGRMEILCGAELDCLSKPIDREGLDYIIGSTHFLDVPSETPLSVDNTPEQLDFLCREFFGGDYLRLSKAYYALEAQVHDRLHCTFVGHFDLITRFNDQTHTIDESSPAYLRAAMEAMEHLVRQGLPFEINCGAVNRGRKKELYPNMTLLRHLHDLGGEILINSDAHQKELLLGAFDQALQAAEACGFDHVNILLRQPQGGVTFHALPLESLK